jgi:hypothetical protein
MINLLSVGVILSIGRMRGRGVGREKQRER